MAFIEKLSKYNGEVLLSGLDDSGKIRYFSITPVDTIGVLDKPDVF
ncbi:MAG: hypothetical protein LBS35_06205 [Synergistaceae bacterium]|nr:hypothetical protein [Synergistaceae bacterium]